METIEVSVVLGISALYHDAAAALVVDGEIAAAIQEERLSRIKNDPSLPFRAAQACLHRAGLQAGDVDKVVYYENPYAKLERVLLSLMRAFPKTWRQFPRALASQLGSKLWVVDQLAEGLGVDRKNVEFVSHHESHAASAFLCSPFEQAAVLVVDAVGENASTSIYQGNGGSLGGLQSVDYPHSLGLFYAAITAFLGFKVNEGEYKVMGLAAYGAPCYREEFEKLLVANSDGSYKLDLSYFAHHIGVENGFSGKLESLLGPRREPHKPWNLSADEDQHYANVAATLQLVIEEAMLALARQAHKLVGSANLCLAGGVALNCVANARILAETEFERVFVQPAAGDAGGALGAALLGAQQLGERRPKALSTAAHGVDLDLDRAFQIATKMGFAVRRVDSPSEVVAAKLIAKRIVGVASGPCEWGPRALGQRSILALPHERDVRERINRVIKQREEFRPFAPAVSVERASEFFVDSNNDMSPFMTTVCKVRDAHAESLHAVTHIDKSARVQTVSAESAPLLHDILAGVGKHNDMPIVLNTSLNGSGEPIAGTATDVLSFFARHPIDALLIGDLMIERSG
jgi:carbamoyltransferase